MVTDLDAHLTQRALSSLAAELTRRERILSAAAAARPERQPGHATGTGARTSAVRPH